jgi:hypothetical protein
LDLQILVEVYVNLTGKNISLLPNSPVQEFLAVLCMVVQEHRPFPSGVATVS